MPTPKVSRSKWSDAESDALGKAFHATTTADEFFLHLRAQVPSAPQRTVKAYLSRLCMLYPDKSARMRPVYVDLCRANVIEEAAFRAAEEAAKGKAPASGSDASPPPTVETPPVTVPSPTASSWVDEIDPTPAPPTTPPRPAPAPNFVKPAVKPDPNARVPRHIPVPPASRGTFSPGEVTALLGLPASSVEKAVSSHKLPVRTVYDPGDRGQSDVITRPVFDVLHAALCEGHSFEHACLLACEKHPAPTPIVSAEHLYAPVVEAPVEPDPNKVREGYIPNPFLKGPFPIVKNREAPALDDPNPDAMDAFTVEEAAAALGLTDKGILLTAINRDGFPAVKIDGKWRITRADLKRVRAMMESGFTTKEALKRGGAGAPPLTVPSETSWTDHVAPLTTEEKGEADGTPDVMDRDPVWETVSLEDLASELHLHVASVYQDVSDHPLVQKHGHGLGVTRQAFDLIEEKWRKCRDLKEAFDFAAEKLGALPPPPPTTEDGEAGDARLPSDMVSLEDVAAHLHIYAHDVYTVMDDYPMLVKIGVGEAYISRAAFNLIQEKWRSCRSLREACDYAVEKLGLTPAKADVSDERQWALEALGEGVFTVEQALKIAGVTDIPRNRWALGLLGRGEINLAQAAKLLR
jgi:hypothetical protein